MKIQYENSTATFMGLRDFDIEHILECGQCFHFEKIGEKHYNIIAYGKRIEVLQERDRLKVYPTTPKDVEEIWSTYFDLQREYRKIKNELSKDEILERAISYKPGIRILKQEPFECLISFIISQNKQIPHIKQVIRNISERFGEKVQVQEGQVYHAFPSLERLSFAKEQDFLECKAGFRAKYIVDACEKLNASIVRLDQLKQMSLDEARSELIKIKGVGNKVADCVLLYGIGHHEAFPKDVWIKRVMEYFYFHGQDTKMDVIEDFAKEKFGVLAGFAQQYLFFYARDLKIGK